MKYLPDPDYVRSDNNHYSNSPICVTPYESKNWVDVVSKYGIKLPDVVDMTKGKSKCSGCGATYVGYQPYCNRIIPHHRTKGAYHVTRGYHPYYSIENHECNGPLVWDLREEFNVQRDFFSLLSLISQLPDIEFDPLYKFSSYFPPGVSEALRPRLVAHQMEFQVRNIHNALNQIATKMNNAGACLSFSF
jgi:hypothetical protein